MSKSKIIKIAIVGRPNVGKSTLFNRIIKNRKAIETDEAGTTRDRLYGDFFWREKKYQLIDTAGLLHKSSNSLEAEAQESTRIALEEAEIILFVVNYKEGITEQDIKISRLVKRRSEVILVINKCDSNFDEEKLIPFKRLGIARMVLVSAISGRNSGDLLDEINDLSFGIDERLDDGATEEKPTNMVAVSLIGRPNAGKSTLLNTLMGGKKMITSEIPGTTRDSQDFEFIHKGNKIIICDTAGIKRKSQVKIGSPDGYALLRSFRAITDSKLVVYLIDAKEGLVSLDQTMLGKVACEGRSVILAVNKIDLWQDKEKQMLKLITEMQEELNFMPWLPVVFISAENKDNINSLLNQIIIVNKERFTEISDEECEQILREAKERNSQIYYIKSLKFERNNPVVFKILTQKKKKPHFSHLRFLENRIREAVPFRGNPIFIDWN